MLSKVKNYISKHNLLSSNDLYIVALSGGADSVALLLLLDEMGYNIHALHCNFHLRGEESDRDEQFCEELCLRKNIPFHRVHFDTLTYAETHKVSIEMAARELRYRYFEQLRKDIGAAGVCVAHHREDSVETVLMNLVRGTGLRGLTGIQPRNGTVLRPLLCVSRAEIEDYLAAHKQSFVTDSTNLETDCQRNKIRLQIMPLLQQLNPAVADNILNTSEHLSEAQQVMDAVVGKYTNSNRLDINELKSLSSIEYITFEWLRKYGFNGSQVQQILSAETGSIFSSAAGYDVLKDRDYLLVEPTLSTFQSVRIPEEGTYVLSDDCKMTVRREAPYVSKDPQVATLDAASVRFPLTVRRVEEGDWMIPYGMTGRKLLSDLMTDLKLSVFDKRRQLVVVDAQGSVLWLVGIRTDNRFRVTGDTKQVISIEG